MHSSSDSGAIEIEVCSAIWKLSHPSVGLRFVASDMIMFRSYSQADDTEGTARLRCIHPPMPSASVRVTEQKGMHQISARPTKLVLPK